MNKKELGKLALLASATLGGTSKGFELFKDKMIKDLNLVWGLLDERPQEVKLKEAMDASNKLHDYMVEIGLDSEKKVNERIEKAAKIINKYL